MRPRSALLYVNYMFTLAFLAPQRQRQNMGRIIPPSMTQDVPPLIPEFRDYKHKLPYRGRNPQGHPDLPPFQPEDLYSGKRDYMEEPFRRADYREGDMDRLEYTDYAYDDKYKENYVEEPQRRPEPSAGPRYDSNLGMTCHQPQYPKYPEEAPPPERRPYPEREPPFFPEEVQHDRGRSSEYHPSEPEYPEDDNQWWSEDRESAPYDNTNRPARQGSREREGKRWDLPPLMQSVPIHQQPNIDTDYSQNTREPDRFAMGASAGPTGTGPQTPQRQVEVSRSISNIPEPFRRFLKGADDAEGGGKRKRKSRFSDATVEEVEQTKKMMWVIMFLVLYLQVVGWILCIYGFLVSI